MRRLPLFMRSPDGEGSGGGEGKDPVEGLKAAIAAERKARQEAEALVAAIEAEKKSAAEKAATEAGEFRKLYEGIKPEHDALKGKIAAYEKAEAERTERVKARNADRIKALPEAGQKAVSRLADALPPEALAEWLDDNAALLGVVESRPAGTQRGKVAEEPIPADCTAEWKKFGSYGTEREWFENTWKPRHKAKGAA